MATMSLIMLTDAQIEEYWPRIEPMYASACNSHEIAKDEMDPETIHRLATEGMCAIFLGFLDEEPACTICLQFNYTNGRKGADLIAMAGEHLLKFKAAYWEIILNWLRANQVEFLDAYVPENRVELYKKKFGFDKSCAYVRKDLH